MGKYYNLSVIMLLYLCRKINVQFDSKKLVVEFFEHMYACVCPQLQHSQYRFINFAPRQQPMDTAIIMPYFCFASVEIEFTLRAI